MRTRWMVAAALLSAGAATAQDAAPAPATDANLFIFRDYAEPTVWAPTVKIDDKKIVAIGQNQYSAVHLTTGEHKISLAWPFLSGQSGKSGKITIEDGKTLYLEVVGTARLVGFSGSAMQILTGSGMIARGPDAAKAIAGCCKFKPAK